MIDDAKIEAAARWLVSRKGDGPALIAAALGARWVEIRRVNPYTVSFAVHIPDGPPVPAVLDPSVDYSRQSVVRHDLGECSDVVHIRAGSFLTSRAAFDEGTARFGKTDPKDPRPYDIALWMARRTIELWRESLPKQEEKH